MKRIWFLILTLWLGLGQINTASAHGLEAGQLSVLIDTVNAGIIAAPYATAFPFADENGDGLLSTAEIDTHRDAIHALIKERVVLRNEAGTAAIMLHIDVAIPEEVATGQGDQAAADFVHVSARAVWSTLPEVIDVEYTLFSSAEESIHYLMQDRETDEVIEGEFSAAETIIRLRGEGAPIETGRAIWLSGIEHVLSGYDHILFVLAMVLATAGLRKLLGPLTALQTVVPQVAVLQAVVPLVVAHSIDNQQHISKRRTYAISHSMDNY